MIKLYGFGSAFNLIDPSPFVTKVNLTMTILGIEFESISSADNLQKAPKGKLPFIDDDGDIIADSTFIIDHLKQKYHADLDTWLDDEQKAIAQLVGKSLDENLYWCLVHSRWINQDTWPTVRAYFFDPLPFPMNKIVPFVAHRSTKKNINGHGMGHHSNQQIIEIARKSLHSLSVLLGDKNYFFGDKPSSLDVATFAFVSGFVQSTLENEMSTMANEFDNLVDFCARIRAQYYP